MAEPLHPTDAGAADPLAFCLRLARADAATARRLDVALSSYHGLSFGDFTILHHLGGAPGGRLRRVDLASRLSLTGSGVTRALIPLEKIGLVSREPDARDARVAYAVLTASGERLLKHALASARLVCQEATSALPAERMGELSDLLAQLGGMNLSNS